ncbi:hypothetical protein [Dyella sp. 333MFSha]|uniref:hypothetical protein n=1 Tax=Dyella sp. 333MFSha TaxID=1798240 RepID=UPI0008900157|nr:hypothetical protein [Dyella sp. 333MFSha]SDF33665.1 hypothetical protein SAMN04515659_0706 [Dyella sp. 333MFSha]
MKVPWAGRPRVWMLVAGIVTAALVALLSIAGPPDMPPARRQAVGKTASATTNATARVVAVSAQGSGTDRLGPLLRANEAFAQDTVFLVAASVRARCDPAHAHDLAAMAAQALLPMLAGVTEAIGEQTDMRDYLLAAVRDVAQRAPCSGPFDMSVGDFVQRVDVVRYAAAFPDSYFDPAMTATPQEFAGRSLADRAHDECGKVAYAVLPLDAPRAWQCAGLRAQGRTRVRALCQQIGEADTAAVQIREAVGRMPPTCQ